jgi:hypothetical protein
MPWAQNLRLIAPRSWAGHSTDGDESVWAAVMDHDLTSLLSIGWIFGNMERFVSTLKKAMKPLFVQTIKLSKAGIAFPVLIGRERLLLYPRGL